MIEPLIQFALELLKAHAPGLAAIIVAAIALWTLAIAARTVIHSIARLGPFNMSISMSIGDHSGHVPSISAQVDENPNYTLSQPTGTQPESQPSLTPPSPSKKAKSAGGPDLRP